MTPKEERFVQEYLIDLNAARAARRAGYSARSARTIGPRLLKRPAVRDALAAARQAQAERGEVSAERVVRELARIAFASSDQFLDWGPAGVSLRDKTLLSPDQHAAIAEVSHNGTAFKLKLHDKMAALDKLARHLDLYGEARADALADREVVELSDTERFQRLLGLLRRVYQRWEQEAAARGETLPPAMSRELTAFLRRILPGCD